VTLNEVEVPDVVLGLLEQLRGPVEVLLAREMSLLRNALAGKLGLAVGLPFPNSAPLKSACLSMQKSTAFRKSGSSNGASLLFMFRERPREWRPRLGVDVVVAVAGDVVDVVQRNVVYYVEIALLNPGEATVRVGDCPLFDGIEVGTVLPQ